MLHVEIVMCCVIILTFRTANWFKMFCIILNDEFISKTAQYKELKKASF